MAVELGRSARQGYWRLFRDSTYATPGRYYEVKDGTPVYPGWHNYGSRFWHDANWTIQQALGEDLSAHSKFNRGTPPPVLPNTQSVGSAACIANGDTIANAVGFDSLFNGFPISCYVQIPNDWSKAGSFGSCATQLIYARIIEWLYDGQTALIITLIDDLFPGAIVTFTDRQGKIPRFCVIKGDTFMVALAEGTTNYQQLALEAFYGIIPPQDYGFIRTNSQWWDAANAMMEAVIAQGYDGTKPLLLSGHSYGGAAACILAARLKFQRPQAIVNWLVYGCPKPGDTQLQNYLTVCNGVGIINNDDPVPALPFDYTDIAPFISVFPGSNLLDWTLWIRLPFEYIQRADGSRVMNNWLPFDATQIFNFIVDAIADNPLSPLTSHSITSYVTRIQRRCPEQAWPANDATWELITTPIPPPIPPQAWTGLQPATDIFGPQNAISFSTLAIDVDTCSLTFLVWDGPGGNLAVSSEPGGMDYSVPPTCVVGSLTVYQLSVVPPQGGFSTWSCDFTFPLTAYFAFIENICPNGMVYDNAKMQSHGPGIPGFTYTTTGTAVESILAIIITMDESGLPSWTGGYADSLAPTTYSHGGHIYRIYCKTLLTAAIGSYPSSSGLSGCAAWGEYEIAAF